MSEIETYVRKRLQSLRMDEAQREEVIVEITGHLELVADEYCSKGWDPRAAQQQALAHFGNHKCLFKGIRREKETGMRERFRRMWLPGLAVGFLAYLTESLMFRFVVRPRAVQVLGHYYAYSWEWLVVVAFIGGLGAWWSREMGASVGERLTVALAPAEIMAAVIAIVLPLGCVIDSFVDRSVPYAVQHPMVLVVAIVWMLHCAVPALIGAAPFLFGNGVGNAQVPVEEL